MRKKFEQLSQNKFHCKYFGSLSFVLGGEKFVTFGFVCLQVFLNPGWEMAFPFIYVASLDFPQLSLETTGELHKQPLDLKRCFIWDNLKAFLIFVFLQKVFYNPLIFSPLLLMIYFSLAYNK